MKNDRLFQIVYLLLEKGTITAPELARALEVSVRTIYRDVEALSIAGVPVYASQGKNGGVSLLPNYAFDKALLSDDEQNQILFAIQSLKATDQPVDALLSKLGGLFQKENANWIEVDFSRWGIGKTDTKKFELLKTALIQKRALEIVYCSSSGETNRRVILPIKLIFKDKSWYLQAYCRKADNFRVFKVNRIVELALLDERFGSLPDEPPPLEPDYMTQPSYQRILLRFSPAIAFRIYDEFDRSSIATQPDGSLVVTAYFPQDGWVVGYLHSFGTDVTILEPAEMRAYVANYAKAIWEHHQKEPD
jgi:predicted DNA-binding transcriptional regulator YafY